MRPLKVGDSVTRHKTIGPEAMELFSRMVGDENPIHRDEESAKAAGFPAPIAQGMIAGSMFSEILGNALPGPGSIYLSQNFAFRAPVFVGDTVELSVEVVGVRPDQKIVTVKTTCRRGDVVCIEGEAVLLRRSLLGHGGKG